MCASDGSGGLPPEFVELWERLRLHFGSARHYSGIESEQRRDGPLDDFKMECNLCEKLYRFRRLERHASDQRYCIHGSSDINH